MGTLIDALLSLARVSRTAIRNQHVDLTQLARSAAEHCHASAPEQAVELVVADGITAWGDLPLLRIVIDNLVGNAWKFTRQRPHPRIEVGSTLVGDEVHYHVRDNGAGFDMAYVDKIFAPFQRLHAVAEFEGTGIGLATVERIIRRHGGRVWAEGKKNEGATFYFALPRESVTRTRELR